jgi:DNA adenine methylase
MKNKERLREYIEMIPCSQDFWNECKNNTPANDIEKAVYFLVLSNFGYMGMPETLNLGCDNSKEILLSNIDKAYKNLIDKAKFLNCDFRDVLKKISLDEKDKENSFLYSDPPYLDTINNYECEKWTEKDVVDCFDVTFNSGIKAALSEFDHPFIVAEAQKRGLNLITIGERCNMKNRRTEILITNFKNYPTLF